MCPDAAEAPAPVVVVVGAEVTRSLSYLCLNLEQPEFASMFSRSKHDKHEQLLHHVVSWKHRQKECVCDQP